MPDRRTSIQVNLKRIAQLPELKLYDQHPEADLVAAYLKRFGYLDPGAPVAQGTLDKTTADGLRTLQKQYNLPQTGALDAPTREFMAADRCGLPDPVGPLNFATVCAWNRRNLTYAFGPLSAQVGNAVAMNAVRRAFATWANCGVGLTFTEVGAAAQRDFTIEWRQANDPDNNMTGGVLAHADFPPVAQSSSPRLRCLFTMTIRNMSGWTVQPPIASTSRPSLFTKSGTCWGSVTQP